MFPVLAIDFGLKRIGLAISDSKGIVCQPLETINVTTSNGIIGVIERIKDVINEYHVKQLLIGKPQVFSEGQEKNIRRIDDFANTIRKRIALPIEFWDESFSTAGAKDMLLSSGKHSKSSKKIIDSVAASIFLQEYLNSKQSYDKENI